MEKYHPVESGDIRTFNDLRYQVHKEIERNIIQRLKTNPVMSPQEIELGSFIEELEYQVKDAVLEMYRKGYETRSSGFYDIDGDAQVIDGRFELDNTTKAKLAELGASVNEEIGFRTRYQKHTHIRFMPERPNLDEIKSKWDSLVAVLPNLNKQVRSMSQGAVMKRYDFAREEGERDLDQISREIQAGVYPADIAKKMTGWSNDIRTRKLVTRLYYKTYKNLYPDQE